MEPADAKASDMAATQTHAAQMRYAAETHPAASAAQMRYAAEAHPTASAAKMHSATTHMETTAATAEVSTAATAADVSTATAAAATATAAAEAMSGVRGQRHHNGRQIRQQDCANHNSVIFHEDLPELHRNVSRLGSSTRRPMEHATIDAAPHLGGWVLVADVSKIVANCVETMADLPVRRCDK